MTYEEATEYLFTRTTSFEKQGAAGYKEGLQTTLALDEHFEHPHHKYKTIHVAGTNGKGSVSHTLAALLQGCGYTVGLYTSPHLIDFRERIRINGEMIPEDYVVSFIENEKDFFEPLAPSFFELTTAMAFKYFSEQDVDIAVIEVGLGGRLDCTNIITPILSVITNISLDHTQLLGASVEQIAM
jgi:dihydrofolate synthase/folylpolyglutamate synthase